MLTQIKNGQLAFKTFIYLPKNKYCIKILNIIYQEGYIRHYLILNDKIQVWLKYYHSTPVIQKICFFSTTQKQMFLSLKQLWKIDCTTQLLVLSSTKGVLSGRKSRKKKVGGKLLFIIK